MIYSSKGLVVAKGVVNASNVLAEYYNAYQIASQTSQWQWKEDAFTDIASFETPSIIESNPTAVTYIWDGDDHSGVGSPTLDFGASRWMIPENSSYSEVGDGDVAVQWSSEYPELVLCAFSYQYVREPNFDIGAGTGQMARVKIQISVDGHLQQGTGPYDKGENTNYPYGAGSQERTMAQTVVCVLPLQAGSHTVTAVAAQADKSVRYGTGGQTLDVSDWFSLTDTYDPLAQIGNRRMIVIRLPKSGWLRAA